MTTIDDLRRRCAACRRAQASAAFSRAERERFGQVADELAAAIAAREDEALRHAATGSQLAGIVVRARGRRVRRAMAAE